MPEVVHQKEDGKWYYWTETWTEEYGPFDTKELAQEACNRYATEVLHHPEAPDQAPVVEPQEPVVLLALMPWSKLSDLDVDIAMEKCCFHEKKGKVDLGLVGEMKKVNPRVVLTQLEGGYIPVISPIGFAPDGGSLNINADTAAAELAIALNASKLIVLTNVEGVLDKKKNIIKRLTIKDVKARINDGTISGGMIPKVEACVQALKGGVARTHIVKASRHAVLEEILTTTGTGTMITLQKVTD